MTSTAQVAAAAGLTYRQLDHWVKRGYLHPTPEHPGYGSGRDWPPAEVATARAMAALVRLGLTVPHAAHYARELAAVHLTGGSVGPVSMTLAAGSGLEEP